MLILFNKMQFKIFLFNKTKLEINFNYFREALRATLKYFYLTKCYMKYFYLAKCSMRLIFIPEKLSEVHCVTAREARSLPFYWFSILKFFLNPVREFPFYHSHVRYTDETKRKFEKSSASEVGVLWAVHLDRFENLRFHHRGMTFRLQAYQNEWLKSVISVAVSIMPVAIKS